jgi:site-specific recombinase XerD
MTRRTLRTPSYCHHKASGQAVVRIDGKDYYLGKHDSPESRAEYDRLMSEWLGNGRRLAAPTTADSLTVAELLLSYWRWAEQNYRTADGNPSPELDDMRYALRSLRALYGHTPAAKFGPLALRTVQEHMAKSGLSRGVVNDRTSRIKRVFRWAASFEVLPAAVYEALRTVPGLRRGRTEAPETEPVGPVAVEVVEATLPFLPAPVAAMTRLQLHSGCRAGEAMVMRAIDLNMTGAVWTYRPHRHKNQNRGLERIIFLGPQAQEAIRPFLTTNLEAYLFSPRAYVAAVRARRKAQRKTKPTPSEKRQQRKAKPKRQPSERYNRRSYRVAVVRGCHKARGKLAVKLYQAGGITLRQARQQAAQALPLWSPLQLRHTAATVIRAKYGVEAAKAILGHSRVETSQIYAERDLKQAEGIMAEIG